MRILQNSKVNTLLIGIMMIAILLCCSSQVQAAQDGDYTYTLTAGKVQITGYTGLGGVVAIPSTVAGFPVTSLGGHAFESCTSLTAISLPQGVTSIGSGAFWGCTGLTAISLPQGLTSIGNYAFTNCTGLTIISLPKGITSIGNLAFSNCAGLTAISFPQGLTSIGDEAFSDCTGLTTISLPQGVTSIGDLAFSGCTGLMSISLPQGVTSIGDGAFTNCTGLTTISLPQGVTRISDGAFTNCRGLTTISLPQGVTTIGNGAFSGCRGLNTISLPQEVTSIGNDAFSDCTSLTTINISSGVTSIGNDAFYGCRGLTNIILPQGVTSLGNCAFYGCAALTTIRFNSEATTIYENPYTIPETTKIIGYDPSTAKTYATKYNREFEAIGALKTLQAIAITTPAAISSYTVGDTLDISGLVVIGIYDDGSTTAASITVANVTGFNSSEAATDQLLTITVSGKTATYIVQIIAAPVNTDTTGMVEMTAASQIVGPSKVWTIKLNGLVDEDSIKNKIYITNSLGIEQATTCTVIKDKELSKIEVKPDNNFTAGNYILWLRDIESVNGTKIKNQVYLRFTVE